MVLACAGHWYVSMLYVAPVAILGGFLKYVSWRDRQEDEQAAQDELAEASSVAFSAR